MLFITYYEINTLKDKKKKNVAHGSILYFAWKCITSGLFVLIFFQSRAALSLLGYCYFQVQSFDAAADW